MHPGLPTYSVQSFRYNFPRRQKGLLRIRYFSKQTPKKQTSSPRNHVIETENARKEKLCKASCYPQNGYLDFCWNQSIPEIKAKGGWVFDPPWAFCLTLPYLLFFSSQPRRKFHMKPHSPHFSYVCRVNISNSQLLALWHYLWSFCHLPFCHQPRYTAPSWGPKRPPLPVS